MPIKSEILHTMFRALDIAFKVNIDNQTTIIVITTLILIPIMKKTNIICAYERKIFTYYSIDF